MFSQAQAEAVTVGDLFVRCEHTAHERGFGECRVEPAQIGGIQNPLRVGIQQVLAAVLECTLCSKRDQLAIAAPGEAIEAVLFTPAGENGLALQGQIQQLGGIAPIDPGTTGHDEGRQPAPLRGVQT